MAEPKKQKKQKENQNKPKKHRRPGLDLVQIEKDMLEFWKKNDIYAKCKTKNKGNKQFYFLDGPPYTSGKVHIGTAWNKALKDCIQRYKRMKGLDVWDRAGYDMHGLPTEHATMKKLKIKNKDDIFKLGVDKFIEECRTLCTENMKIMNDDFTRLGVWMDFENAYQSITKEFMDGEWWLIKQAHEKGRLYEGLRVMHWCAKSESALAKHELEYENVTDDSIFVKFKITKDNKGNKPKDDEYLIIWTTTPWTIAFNLGVMVNPELNYVKAKVGDETWYVAAQLVGVFIGGVADKKYEVIDEFKGDAMEGIEYEHPFYTDLKDVYDEIKAKAPKAHTVLLSSEYVDTTSGSGLVHTAPGCGPEDYEVGHRNGIPPFNALDTKGAYNEKMGKFAGMVAKKDDKKFVEALDEKGALVAITQVEHEYPHDWRHHEPVLFRTTKQWFFKVEDLKEKMIESNQNIKWNPHAAFNAFDSWLKNLRDNSISKQRYWGTPIPIWKNIDKNADEDDYIVVGSSAELEKLSGQKIDDLHIPTVDKIEIKKDGKTYKRIPDVLDVWVDAGTVSWNCLDYPAKEDKFKELFPADFIMEGKDQIRGWFNLLMVASTIAMDKPSFKNVYMHGFVQDSKGRKMSKSLGNYILPEEVVEEYGADTFRYYSIGGTNPGLDLNYNFEDMKLKNRNLTILWNIHRFLIDMSKTIGKKPGELDEKIITNMLDVEEKFILSRLNSSIKKITEHFDTYELNEAPWVVEKLLFDLSRTYMQFVREKSSVGEDSDKDVVIYTINKVLFECLKIFAPIAPFITEKIYQNLKDAFGHKEESIHLFEWPEAQGEFIDTEIEQHMESALSIIQSILSVREKTKTGVRWPISEVIVTTKNDEVKAAVEQMKKIIMIQTNIKDIKVLKELKGVKDRIKLDFKKLTEGFGEMLATKIVAKVAIDSPQKILNDIEKEGAYKLKIDGTDLDVTKEYLMHERDVPEPYAEGTARKALVYLDTERTPELDAEGFSRELMRRIQNARKKMGLQKLDSVSLYIQSEKDNIDMLQPWENAIKEKVGAEDITLNSEKPSVEYEYSKEEGIKHLKFTIFLMKL